MNPFDTIRHYLPYLEVIVALICDARLTHKERNLKS